MYLNFNILQSKPQLLTGGLLLASAFFIATIQNTIVKLIAPQTGVWIILFIQYAVCLFLYTPSVLKKRKKIFNKKNNTLLLIRALAGIIYFFLMFLALKSTPLTDVALLTNTSPLWVPLIYLIFFKKKLSPAVYSALIIGFIGISFILAPDGNIKSEGSIFALLGGVVMAVSLVSIKQLTLFESHARISIYYFLLGTLFTLPFAIIYSEKISFILLILMILNGLFMFAQQKLICVAFNYGSASRLSVMIYSSVIFSALIDFILWKHPINLTMGFGAILIILSGVKVLMPRNSFFNYYLLLSKFKRE